MPLTFARTSHRYGPHMHGQNNAAYYNPLAANVNGTRLLYHSALEKPSHRICVYPFLPDETTDFTWDVRAPRDLAISKTLKSKVFAKYDRIMADTIIKEIFRPDGGVAATWELIHKIERMWLNDPDWDNGEYLIWRPYDRNHKAYAVDILNITVNGEEWNPEFRGNTFHYVDNVDYELQFQQNQERWAVNEVQVWLKIRAEEAPQAGLFAVGGSDSSEASLFNINEV